MKHKKIIASLLAAAMIIGTASGFSTPVSAETTVEDAVIQSVENWFMENYEPFYDIIDEEFTVTRTHDNGGTTSYTVSVYCQTKLKSQEPEDIPYVKGLYDAMATQRATNAYAAIAATAIDDYVSTLDITDDYNVLTMDIVVEVSNNPVTRSQDSFTLYYQDGMDTQLSPIEDLELDSSEMYANGLADAQPIISEYAQKASTASTRGYSAYDRIAARDYAFRWTGSNVTSCYDHGYSCGMLQDRTKWNNSDYYYISTLVHDDCTDFVSQCMHAGGIPIDPGKWERFVDAANGWTWTYAPELRRYMVDKGYWDESDFYWANAGNILYQSDGGHIMLITLNDGVTNRFTAHTNDRYNYVFYDSSDFLYYAINISD